tara:strand:+ start:705 stop:908 length:204 start_codon:yes stop_codon:yes gene_type:complete
MSDAPANDKPEYAIMATVIDFKTTLGTKRINTPYLEKQKHYTEEKAHSLDANKVFANNVSLITKYYA